jgi:hypothetical protein
MPHNSTYSFDIKENLSSSFDPLTPQYKYDIGIDSDIEKTKTFEEFIKEDEKLKKEYENLNCYYNFALKSLKYFIPKLGKGLQEDQTTKRIEFEFDSNLSEDDKHILSLKDSFETEIIRKTNQKLNDLFIDSVPFNFNIDK